MSTQERLHSLDAVRGFALLLGIVLHATMSFFLPIPALDSSQSTTLAGAFYVIHIFRMSLFYLIAGFFAHMALHRRGTRAFVKDRSRRILVPMLAGWVVLAPITIVLVIWGLSRTFGPAAGDAQPQAASDSLPLTHLWFLYYLSIFYVLALVVRAAFDNWIDGSGRIRTFVDRILGLILPNLLGPVVLAVPLALTLATTDGWVASGGIPTPDTGLIPKLPAMVGFGMAFAVGWFLHRQIGLLSCFRRRWPQFLALAVALTAAGLWLTPPAVGALEPPAPLEAETLSLYAFGYSVAIWCWSFAIIGAALSFCDGYSPVRRYIADSSYWLYLAHLPIVFLLQILVADWPLHWSVKFPLILAVTLAVLFASYHYLVRPTFIGEILNGRKYPRGARKAGTVTPGPDTSGPEPKGPGPRTTPGRGLAGLASSAVVRFDGATKRFGETLALDKLDLEVRRGELLALLGPNGAGKTTAISLSLGLLEADEGEIELLGGTPFETQNRLGVGMMLQEVNLAPGLRARQLVELVSSYYPAPLALDEVLQLAGIEEFADKAYSKLSGGQKRRVQFAAAICGNPRLLFLDEPTTGLDIDARQSMWKTIRAFVDRGCSIVLTTHYLEEAEALADRVAVLAQGRLVALGSVDEMRSLVSRKQIRCASTISPDEIRTWPGVTDVTVVDETLEITAIDAEDIVRRLLTADNQLSKLEVRQASLSEAFTEITREAA